MELKQNLTLYNRLYNLEFYHITKNAMTATIHNFPGGFEWVPSETLPNDALTFCILRDPVQRIISSYESVGLSARKSVSYGCLHFTKTE